MATTNTAESPQQQPQADPNNRIAGLEDLTHQDPTKKSELEKRLENAEDLTERIEIIASEKDAPMKLIDQVVAQLTEEGGAEQILVGISSRHFRDKSIHQIVDLLTRCTWDAKQEELWTQIVSHAYNTKVKIKLARALARPGMERESVGRIASALFKAHWYADTHYTNPPGMMIEALRRTLMETRIADEPQEVEDTWQAILGFSREEDRPTQISPSIAQAQRVYELFASGTLHGSLRTAIFASLPNYDEEKKAHKKGLNRAYIDGYITEEERESGKYTPQARVALVKKFVTGEELTDKERDAAIDFLSKKLHAKDTAYIQTYFLHAVRHFSADTPRSDHQQQRFQKEFGEAYSENFEKLSSILSEKETASPTDLLEELKSDEYPIAFANGIASRLLECNLNYENFIAIQKIVNKHQKHLGYSASVDLYRSAYKQLSAHEYFQLLENDEGLSDCDFTNRFRSGMVAYQALPEAHTAALEVAARRGWDALAMSANWSSLLNRQAYSISAHDAVNALDKLFDAESVSVGYIKDRIPELLSAATPHEQQIYADFFVKSVGEGRVPPKLVPYLLEKIATTQSGEALRLSSAQLNTLESEEREKLFLNGLKQREVRGSFASYAQSLAHLIEYGWQREFAKPWDKIFGTGASVDGAQLTAELRGHPEALSSIESYIDFLTSQSSITTQAKFEQLAHLFSMNEASYEIQNKIFTVLATDQSGIKLSDTVVKKMVSAYEFHTKEESLTAVQHTVRVPLLSDDRFKTIFTRAHRVTAGDRKAQRSLYEALIARPYSSQVEQMWALEAHEQQRALEDRIDIAMESDQIPRDDKANIVATLFRMGGLRKDLARRALRHLRQNPWSELERQVILQSVSPSMIRRLVLKYDPSPKSKRATMGLLIRLRSSDRIRFDQVVRLANKYRTLGPFVNEWYPYSVDLATTEKEENTFLDMMAADPLLINEPARCVSEVAEQAPHFLERILDYYRVDLKDHPHIYEEALQALKKIDHEKIPKNIRSLIIEQFTDGNKQANELEFEIMMRLEDPSGIANEVLDAIQRAHSNPEELRAVIERVSKSLATRSDQDELQSVWSNILNGNYISDAQISLIALIPYIQIPSLSAQERLEAIREVSNRIGTYSNDPESREVLKKQLEGTLRKSKNTAGNDRIIREFLDINPIDFYLRRNPKALSQMDEETRKNLAYAVFTEQGQLTFEGFRWALNELVQATGQTAERLRTAYSRELFYDNDEERFLSDAKLLVERFREDGVPKTIEDYYQYIHSLDSELSFSTDHYLSTLNSRLLNGNARQQEKTLQAMQSLPVNEETKRLWNTLLQNHFYASVEYRALEMIIPDERFSVEYLLQTIPIAHARLRGIDTGSYIQLAQALAKRPWSPEVESLWQPLFIVNSSMEYDYRSKLNDEIVRAQGFPIIFDTPDMPVDIRVKILEGFLSSNRNRTGAMERTLIAQLRKYPKEPLYTKLWEYLDGTKEDQEQLRREISGHDPEITQELLDVVHRPGAYERAERLFQSLIDPVTLEKIQRMVNRGSFAPLVRDLLHEREEHVSDSYLADVINGRLRSPDTSPDQQMKIWPIANVNTPSAQVSSRVQWSSMIIIGDGPAAILMTRMRKELGYLDGTTTIISKRGELGGIWTRDNVLDEGHNTFSSIQAFDAQLEATEPRPGADIDRFLENLKPSEHRDMTVSGEANGIEYDSERGQYRVFVKRDGVIHEHYADSVLVASGNRIPKDLTMGYMKTNVAECDLKFKRWQETIPKSHYPRFHKKRPLLIGLGNSTIAMIGEFMRMRNEGVDVEPVILTHYSTEALFSPEQYVRGKDGGLEGPIFRNRSNLSKIAGDIPRIRDRYYHALNHDWIIPDVTEWNIVDDQNGEPMVIVESRDERYNGTAVGNLGQCYGLIGYRNDPELMERFGIVCDPTTGSVVMNHATGRAETTFEDDPGRVYVLGAAASNPTNRNHEVIPGMMSTVPRTAFTDIIAAEKV